MSDSNLDEIEHHSESIGALPIVRHFMDRIGLDELLELHVPPKSLGRQPKILPAKALSIMISNVILSREPLYGVTEWACAFPPELFDSDPSTAPCLNDDRIGRALERLYELEPSSLMTAVVTKVVREFDVDLEQIHNDSTTVTFSGAYAGQEDREDRKRPPLITFGHNKDHRPDLKQLVYSLTISADGAVPVHYKTYDGNTSDDRTHIDTWQTVRKIRGDANFMYVADSKLCSRGNMRFIEEQGGRFLTVVPRTRKEHIDFRAYIQDHLVPWKEVFRKEVSPNPDKPDQVYEAVELSMTAAEGFRLIWYRSSVKVALDEKHRLGKIMKARDRLETIASRMGAHALRTVGSARKAADAILEKNSASRWLNVSFTAQPTYQTKQVSPGRPGPDTEYRRVRTADYIIFHIEENVDAIQADARCDGIFAMMTNDRDSTPKELLAIYKFQPFLEKRNEQLKSVLAVAPVFLKKPERVAGLLFVYFLAVLIYALIERETRLAMKKAGLSELPLYPEGRACRAPTTDTVMRAIDDHRRHHLVDSDGKRLKTFHDPVSQVGKKVLKLLDVEGSHFGL